MSKTTISVFQLTSYFSQEEICQQAPVNEEEETAGDAGHAAGTKEVKSGYRGNMQGGPSSHAPAEPTPGSVSAAAGAYDESSGEDDPDSLCHISVMGSEWGQRSWKAMKCVG